jgi:hypothetical protein
MCDTHTTLLHHLLVHLYLYTVPCCLLVFFLKEKEEEIKQKAEVVSFILHLTLFWNQSIYCV